MGSIRFLVILGVMTALASSQQQIMILKTLENEQFRTDSLPSVTNNISYVKAVDLTNRNQIQYSLESQFFSINKFDGRIFLISMLPSNSFNQVTEVSVRLNFTCGFEEVSIVNKIRIVNAVNKAPEFVTKTRIFEIEEDNAILADLKSRDGKIAEIYIRNPFPTQIEVFVGCQDTIPFTDACKMFVLNKNVFKSDADNWYGTIKIKNKLNYLQKSVYQFSIVAMNGVHLDLNSTLTVIVKVNPSMKNAPKISSDSLFFTVTEENFSSTLIGELKIDDSYEQNLKLSSAFSLVNYREELVNSGILFDDDVKFDLVKKYLQIVNGNKLFTNGIIDRDSEELKSVNGILRAWIKVYYSYNSNIANYYKITIILNDINDNIPKFSIVNPYIINSQWVDVDFSQSLVSRINENEKGPIVFDDVNIINGNIDSRYFIFYDSDFGLNASFKIGISEYTKDLIKYPINQLLAVMTFNPFNSLNGSETSDFTINSKSSLNVINYKPLDFENLSLNPFIDPFTGIATKTIKFNIEARETLSAERFKSEPIPITLIIQDSNDNEPVFSQDTFFAFATEIINDPSLLPQQIGTFEVTDKDLGVYGFPGLQCNLFGEGSQLFMVDVAKKKIFLKPCAPQCSINSFEKFYELTLACKDNSGYGRVGFATLVINFQSAFRPSFKSPNAVYYLLATGPSGTQIPTLNIKPLSVDPSNKITYTIQSNEMSRLFYVDSDGYFKILVPQLTSAQSNNRNGTFFVPIQLTDMQGNAQSVKVIVQLSSVLTAVQCPKITDNVDCKYTVNRTNFFPKQVRFCLYGANTIVNQPIYNTDLYYSQIYFSLLPDSPDYLYINPYDGCVKVMPWFNKQETAQINYKIGVFNLAYPDCKYVSQISCAISIEGLRPRKLSCPSKFVSIDNTTFYRLQAYSSDSNSIINYKINREERTRFDGRYEIVNNSFALYFKINSRNGQLELILQRNTSIYTSILVVVEVNDLVYDTQSTECLVDFRFVRSASNPTPKFIGDSVRYQDVLEDIPVNTLIYSLRAFDPNLQFDNLCYSVGQNDYFELAQDKFSKGDVSLKKKFDFELLQVTLNRNSNLNFTAALYYCNRPELLLDKQVVIIKVQQVNKYPPSLILPAARVVISLDETTNKRVVPTFGVIDGDASPYDTFNCVVENDQNFSIVNNNNDKIVYLTYASSKEKLQNYLPYVDLSIKCCDDSTAWNPKKSLFSQPKCSLTPIRVEFVNYTVPLQCINNQQTTYVPDNMGPNSYVTSAQCFSNYSSENIKYQLLTNSDLFTIDSVNGSIYLKNQITLCNLESQKIQVKCSNGFMKSICTYNVNLFPAFADYRPVWVNPTPLNSSTMTIYIKEDTPISTLATKVSAIVPNHKATIYYSFIQGGLTRNDLYEFEFRNSFSGEIVLKNKLDSSMSIVREVTLVATYFRKFNCSYSQYQYLRIIVIPNREFKPCFLNKKPDNKPWPYQIILNQNSPSSCFYEQKIQISNKDPIYSSVYYYLLPSNRPNDLIVQNFILNAESGLLCIKQFVKLPSLACSIVTSPYNYVDEFNNICYDLNLYASIDSSFNLKLNPYDCNDCAYTNYKVCVNDINLYGPKFSQNKIVSVFSLDYILKWEALCLHQFKFLSDKRNADYNYMITSVNNSNFVQNMFSVDNTLDCLNFELSSCFNKTSMVGKHKLYVRAYDQCGRFDETTVNVYIIASCRFKSLITVNLDSKSVLNNLDSYSQFLSELASAIFSRDIEVVIHKVYDGTDEIDNFLASNTITLIELAFYDIGTKNFLRSNDIVGRIKVNLKIYQAKLLGIVDIKNACPAIKPPSDFSYYLAVIIIIVLLVVLCLLIPLLFSGVLCPAFKILKCQDNRIIMREKCIPIIECAPPAPKVVCTEVCTDIPVQPCTSNLFQNNGYSSADYLNRMMDEPLRCERIVYQPNDMAFRSSRYGMTENTKIRSRRASDGDESEDMSRRHEYRPAAFHVIGDSLKNLSEANYNDYHIYNNNRERRDSEHRDTMQLRRFSENSRRDCRSAIYSREEEQLGENVFISLNEGEGFYAQAEDSNRETLI